jgi:hypothetical protein
MKGIHILSQREVLLVILSVGEEESVAGKDSRRTISQSRSQGWTRFVWEYRLKDREEEG